MRECFFRLIEHERAAAMERAVWRRRIEEEDVVELLHVEETEERKRDLFGFYLILVLLIYKFYVQSEREIKSVVRFVV